MEKVFQVSFAVQSDFFLFLNFCKDQVLVCVTGGRNAFIAKNIRWTFRQAKWTTTLKDPRLSEAQEPKIDCVTNNQW